jgi:hypothetical protein
MANNGLPGHVAGTSAYPHKGDIRAAGGVTKQACPDIVLLLLGGAMTLEHINPALFEYLAPAIKPNLT